MEPCVFGVETGFYDNYGDIHLGNMVHGINYPDETGRDEMEVRLWSPVMRDGVIRFIRPEECTQVRRIAEMKPKSFDESNLQTAEELLAQIEAEENT
ncbi:hypothetical protein D3C75_1020160 [compost metagenome]